MSDDDLRAVREYRADVTSVPAGLADDIEARLRSLADAERIASVAGQSGPVRRRIGRIRLLRPVGAVAAIVIAATMIGQFAPSVRQTGGGAGEGRPAAVRASAAASSSIVEQAVTLLFEDADAVERGQIAEPRPIHDVTGHDPHEIAERSVDAASRLAASDHAAARIAFAATLGWVADESLAADVRVAHLRSLDLIHGVDEAALGADLLGRRGIVIGHLDVATGMRDQFVLDASDGTLLERRSFTTMYVDPACPPGTFTRHEVYEHGSIVVPTSVPWIAWPVTVGACDPDDALIARIDVGGSAVPPDDVLP